MPTYSTKKQPIATWTETFGANGSFTSPYRLAYGGSSSYTKPIAVKRKKPRDLRAADSQTNWSNSTFESFGSSCSPRFVATPPNTTVYHDAMSDHFSIDYIDVGDLPSANYTTLLGNKCVGKLKDGFANLANMLGEYRRTAKLFYDLTPRFAAVTIAALKKDPKLFAQALGFTPGNGHATLDKNAARAASLLLQWRYGVSPLVDDLSKSMAQLRGAVSRPLYFPVEASHKDSFIREWTTSSRLDVPGKVMCRSTGRRKDVLKGYYILRNDILLAGLGGNGMTNPLSLAWELLPGSFIIDWWFNVGDVLSSLDHSLYVQGSSATITSRQSYVTTGRIYGGASWARQTSYSRRVVTLPVRATLAYKPSVSLTHIQNGLALLTVALHSIYKSKR